MNPARRVLRDAATMLHRDVRHSLRHPAMTVSGMAVPILFLLLFGGVFGSALRAGLGGGASGGYIGYILPGILVMTAASAAEGTAINVCMDMTTGIIARLRTMAIARTAVLTGQVLGSLLRTLVSGAAVVGAAFAMGFRAAASPAAWAGAVAVFAMLVLALSWLSVAFGLLARTPAGANSLSLIAVVLPFVSSAFVPTATMPAGVRWFAANQPFTPIVDALRGLLDGAPRTGTILLALAWCAAIAAGGNLWARALHERLPARAPLAAGL